MSINLIEGSYRNIKITFPEDIAIAEAILKTRLGKWS
jgi:2-C-methyl-D-erythritol 4-phosphate cytidylyltransferase